MKINKSIQVVLAATFYMLFYLIMLSSDSTLRIAFFLFSLSPVVLVWMVFTILKDENKSRKTFDDYFYEDLDEHRS